MATFFSSSNSKRNGPQHSKDNANAIALVKNPVKADSWAQFLAKVMAQAAITSADINIVDEGEDVKVTVNGKSGIDQSQTAAVADDICMAIIDTVAEEVKYCIDANDKAISNDAGDTIDLPSMSFYIREFKAV